jgi:NADH-quinone oxidoreductase subunit K
MMISQGHFLALAAILFGIGMMGVITRRNLLAIFLSIELMLNSANLALAAFAYYNWSMAGQAFVFMVIVVAAGEAAVGLGIIVSIYRQRATLNVDDLNLMKW